MVATIMPDVGRHVVGCFGDEIDGSVCVDVIAYRKSFDVVDC